jgi:hypothetical protein
VRDDVIEPLLLACVGDVQQNREPLEGFLVPDLRMIK